MKHIFLNKAAFGTVLVVAMMAFLGAAQAQSQDKQAKKVGAEIASAFSRGQLRKLDPKKLVRGSIRLTIENSIGEPEFEYYSFRSFAAMGSWIKKREIEGLPNKVAWPLVGCRKGTCTFFRDGGILHNQLYIKKVTYGYRNKRLYIRGIQLLAG